MCGIVGAVSLSSKPVESLAARLSAMSTLIIHRGPDGHGLWTQENQRVGFAHRRLAIIELSEAGHQPMKGRDGAIITYNGEIYNHIELRDELEDGWSFQSHSDTEVILAAHAKWGMDCLSHLRGMFAFAIWKDDAFFAARDRFGIKPFYYAVVDGVFYFASEIKALLPVLPDIETDPEALAEYLTFQYTIGDRSMFKNVHVLMPGHALTICKGELNVFRYWDVHYEIDYDHSQEWFVEQLRERMDESVRLHSRSDVPVGAYISGGIDSSLVGYMAGQLPQSAKLGFHGKFTEFPGYDESNYAQMACDHAGIELHQIDITAADFHDHIAKVIYHLDHPVAGPGAFPQYMVSKLASQHVKVVLGGQGGDEIFAGYARYLVAYLEQCIKAAIDGTYKNKYFVVTPESIIQNLTVLQEYKPLIRQFFSKGLFESMDRRYIRLIDKSADMQNEVDWAQLDRDGVMNRFLGIFNSSRNVHPEAYLDSMMHFDFKCLLPALLHVEDRMAMAHGIESRVPFLDHRIVEFAATVPPIFKFEGGKVKQMLKDTFAAHLPEPVLNRRDKMGFPVPLKEWFAGDLKELVGDVFATQKQRHRQYFNTDAILANFNGSEQFSRKGWGLLSIELWHQQFHDKAASYRDMVKQHAPLSETLAASA
ncbi:MAG: asparagine synthase (glutamine-hydrolyzing) [Pseudomonadota bacterium]